MRTPVYYFPQSTKEHFSQFVILLTPVSSSPISPGASRRQELFCLPGGSTSWMNGVGQLLDLDDKVWQEALVPTFAWKQVHLWPNNRKHPRTLRKQHLCCRHRVPTLAGDPSEDSSASWAGNKGKPVSSLHGNHHWQSDLRTPGTQPFGDSW